MFSRLIDVLDDIGGYENVFFFVRFDTVVYSKYALHLKNPVSRDHKSVTKECVERAATAEMSAILGLHSGKRKQFISINVLFFLFAVQLIYESTFIYNK